MVYLFLGKNQCLVYLICTNKNRMPRGGDRHGPNHTSSAALCVELSELTSSIPIGVMGRAARFARARAAGVYYRVELGKFHLCITAVVLQAISGTAINNNGHLRTISFETATPMLHASGRSPRGGDRPGPNHSSLSALCVELSELTSSVPIGVMG